MCCESAPIGAQAPRHATPNGPPENRGDGSGRDICHQTLRPRAAMTDAHASGAGDREPGRLQGHSLDSSVRPCLQAYEGTSELGTYNTCVGSHAAACRNLTVNVVGVSVGYDMVVPLLPRSSWDPDEGRRLLPVSSAALIESGQFWETAPGDRGRRGQSAPGRHSRPIDAEPRPCAQQGHPPAAVSSRTRRW